MVLGLLAIEELISILITTAISITIFVVVKELVDVFEEHDIGMDDVLELPKSRGAINIPGLGSVGEVASLGVALAESISSSGKISENKDTISESELEDMPEDVQDSYNEREKEGWKDTDEPKKGGGDWKNRKGQLPKENKDGSDAKYREYDVNQRKKGKNRDAERFVRNEDTGETYYTDDHYGSFTKIN